MFKRALAFVLFSLMCTSAFADAQVVNGLDATEPTMGADADNTPPALPVPVPEASGSLSQQVSDLRQQVATQTQMLQQVQALQQQTQLLQGQLEDQQHAVSQLQQQQLQQYQDLDSRLTALTQQVNGLKSPVTAQPGQVVSTGVGTSPAPIGAPASVVPIPPQAPPSPASVVVPPVKKAAVNSTPHAALTQSQLYQAAYNQMLGKHYDQAIEGMQNYLAQYPSGSYAPNAYYWLGELYLLQGNVAQATQSFSTVVNQFPQSAKVPDAMLKLGFAYYDQGNNAQAIAELKAVQQQFPNSSAARLAGQRLQSIAQ